MKPDLAHENALMACSISAAFRTWTTIGSIANDRAGHLHSGMSPILGVFVTPNFTTFMLGAISFSSPSHFPPMAYSK